MEKELPWCTRKIWYVVMDGVFEAPHFRVRSRSLLLAMRPLQIAVLRVSMVSKWIFGLSFPHFKFSRDDMIRRR